MSTKCRYKCKERFLSEGKAGLLDKKKTPMNLPKKIPEEVILELIKLRNNKKFWGSKKIVELYKRKFPHINSPDKSTIDRIEPGKP
ncbi:helix-turn-helix domain-containing protein [Leptospira sp. GIMC2001]|uniref:helix-turn-helix domain-containing protein n=1 Tax=Leptospira sp. GIMC2001 TaxID=1513297 RepID=UPI002349E882|nr:helix-turn-helix domain-containing protein [Leptospira sp. GIMC2001]WCL51315.1 helix-turn-helix domain-containing protein [Leptospira sp. GIMC2001]